MIVTYRVETVADRRRRYLVRLALVLAALTALCLLSPPNAIRRAVYGQPGQRAAASVNTAKRHDPTLAAAAPDRV